MKVELNQEQIELKEIIETNLSLLKKDIAEGTNMQESERQRLYQEMSDKAHALHMQLEPKPKHRDYMIENSGMEPEDPEFYYHIHPVEDLLDYLEDNTANDDPVDATIGDSFNFRIFTNRWGHKDSYIIIRNEEGWKVSFNAYDEQGDKSADPAINKVMTHDSVNFPRTINDYFYGLWVNAKNEGMNHSQVQDALDVIAEWVSECEEKAPTQYLI
ncbi:hypothetical protein IQ283_14035 [Alkalihalobacillus hwajinpoensis]|uniref:hypothetical protein n=1 Tax=Guptibacillus hwajinpoensis TaxID=208199 RepID=UPI0018848B14|nr:hypothetical protein [Pseudalkalibacillus hwajinpoensis]MBF0707712.1 hypothetical protein [Pseudalkalibacillus hwajinpoensis]